VPSARPSIAENGRAQAAAYPQNRYDRSRGRSPGRIPGPDRALGIMHEFALASSIRDIVLETACANRGLAVRRVVCRVGALRQVVPDLIRTAFAACCADSIASGAELLIEIDPVKANCRDCGQTTNCDTMPYECPRCGSFEIALSGGSDLLVASVTIDQEDEAETP
jgi:hydrogenase nickel incorporation protein HypA/HybF